MLKIQKAKSEDAVEIKKLLRITWDDTYSDVFSPEQIDKITSEWHHLDFLKKQIEDPDILFLVAKENEKIIGMCNTDKIEGDHINIQRLHVSPVYQRKGIGSKLMEKVIATYPKTKKIELEVEKNNRRAIAFYQKQGFKEVAAKSFEVDSITIPCLVMEKII